MQVLLSFCGAHDPFTEDKAKPGPILALLGERAFDHVYLYSTPAFSDRTYATRQVIVDRHPSISVEVIPTGLEDPTDYLSIQAILKESLTELWERYGGIPLWICVTSGTPQIHASWVFLAQTLPMDLRLLQVRAPKYVSAESPLIQELRLSWQGEIAGSNLRASHATWDGSSEGAKKLSTSHPDSNLETPPPMGQIPDIFTIAEDMGLIAVSEAMREVLLRAQRFARMNGPVLITGETGTGKELLARFVHRMSGRKERQLVTINCGAISEGLAESELFGVVKGAYTDARSDRQGKFGSAHNGTLFMDEIGDLPLKIQATILRALENHEIEPVGGDTKVVDVRLIAATNLDLQKMVDEKQFRADLLSRLEVLTLVVPPLSSRKEDIPRLAQSLLERINKNEGQRKNLTPAAMRYLVENNWKANVRSLRSAIQFAWATAEEAIIDVEAFPTKIADKSDPVDAMLPSFSDGFQWNAFRDTLRDKIFAKALVLTGGNASAAARLLGVKAQAVSSFLKDKRIAEVTEKAL